MTALLEARGLSRRFGGPPPGLLARLRGARAATVHAVEDIDLSVAPQEALGLVGESGCGKSTLGRMLAGILPPSAGDIRWAGQPVAGLRGPDRRAWTLGVQMVFQDPQASLNPRRRVVDLVGEAPLLHGITGRAAIRGHVAGLLAEVGLDAAALDRLPHEFSGGQRQRIGIARALAVQPAALVCDEAVSALDVSVQAQVINLLADLRARRGLALLFIGHDLSVVRHLADRVAVMYLGRIVEEAPAPALFRAPVPSLHAGVAGADAAAGSGPQALRRPVGGVAVPAAPAGRLRLPSPLPAQLRALPGGTPGAAACRPGPARRLPPSRRRLGATSCQRSAP